MTRTEACWSASRRWRLAPAARSAITTVRSTEATANPESVLHGHKQDKIGATRAELGKMGGEDWHGFLQTIKQDWVGKLEAANDTAQKRKVGRTNRSARGSKT
ncbi:hypothetical protein SALBM311S_01003 [Streptomyces alboniger]